MNEPAFQNREFSYYERRAEEELDLAQQASDDRVVAAHYQLASLYLEMIHPETREQRPDSNG